MTKIIKFVPTSGSLGQKESEQNAVIIGSIQTPHLIGERSGARFWIEDVQYPDGRVKRFLRSHMKLTPLSPEQYQAAADLSNALELQKESE